MAMTKEEVLAMVKIYKGIGHYVFRFSPTKYCGHCRNIVYGLPYCQSCGAKLQYPRCPGCSREITGNERFCSTCGIKLSKENWKYD